MSILVLQHHDLYGAGRLGQTLRDHGFRLVTIRLDREEGLPPDLDGVDAVVSLGGPQQVSEGHAFIERECSLLRSAQEGGLPVIGIGLGAQLLAVSMGGTVAKMEHAEAGFVDIEIVPSAHTEPVYAGVSWRSKQFTRHESEVTDLPAGSAQLATSRRCKHQAFRVGLRSYGFQYHPECDRSAMDALIADARTMLHASGVTSDEFAAEAEREYAAYSRLAGRLFVNLATFAVPRVANEVRG